MIMRLILSDGTHTNVWHGSEMYQIIQNIGFNICTKTNKLQAVAFEGNTSPANTDTHKEQEQKTNILIY